MGFLKRLFGIENEIKEITLSISKMPGWIESIEKNIINELNEKLHDSNSNLVLIKENLKKAIESLETAQVNKDAKFPKRASSSYSSDKYKTTKI